MQAKQRKYDLAHYHQATVRIYKEYAEIVRELPDFSGWSSYINNLIYDDLEKRGLRPEIEFKQMDKVKLKQKLPLTFFQWLEIVKGKSYEYWENCSAEEGEKLEEEYEKYSKM